MSHLSLEEVLSDLLLYIWEIGKSQMTKSYEYLDAQSDVRHLSVLLRIAVPSTFTDTQNQMYNRAATTIEDLERQAGRTVKTELITEPAAALAGLLEKDPAIVIKVSKCEEMSGDGAKISISGRGRDSDS